MTRLFISFSILFIGLSIISSPIASAESSSTPTENRGSLVNCGFGEFEDKCSISDIFVTADLLAQFIIKIIFPTVFFVALSMVLLPLIRDPSNPVVRAEAKKKVKPLLIGTACVIGAYLIIGTVLRSIGISGDSIINKAFDSTTNTSYLYNIIGIDIVSAEASTTRGFFPNPLGDNSVQNLLLGIANGVVFILVIAGGYCLVRGGFGLLLYSRDNPQKMKENKWWFIIGASIVILAFGSQYIIGVVYNTASDFVISTGGTIKDVVNGK